MAPAKRKLVGLALGLLVVCSQVSGTAATPEKKHAKRQADRIAIGKALGLDCGKGNKDCASAAAFDKKLHDFELTKLPEAEVNPVLAGNKAVSLYLHEEGAVKQFLFETGVVKDTDFEGGSVFTEQASCRKERFSLVGQNMCVPTSTINKWMAGKMARPTRTPQTQCPPLIRLAPPLDFDFRNDGGPFVAKAPPPHKPHGDSKDRRHAVQSMATYLRLHPEINYSAKVKGLLYPIELWDDKEVSKLQKSRDHFQVLAKRYRTQLENAIGAGGFDSLSADQKTLLTVVQEAGLNITLTPQQEETVMEAVVDLLSTNPEEEVQERVEEFEEDGSLVVSIIMWTFALAVPIGLLVFLRTKTTLLGKPPAPGKAGSAGGPPRTRAVKGDSAGGASPSGKPGALLRQLEEENMRLRQAVVNIPSGPAQD